MFKRSYCLKCKSNTESVNPKVLNASNEKFFFQNLQCVIVTNEDLLKNKIQADY